MTARDWLPAHLVPPGELHGDFGRLTFGTPPSPETRLEPARAMIRQAGVYGTELHVRTADRATTIILPLDEDQLLGLIDEAMSGLFRARAGRRNERRST